MAVIVMTRRGVDGARTRSRRGCYGLGPRGRGGGEPRRRGAKAAQAMCIPAGATPPGNARQRPAAVMLSAATALFSTRAPCVCACVCASLGVAVTKLIWFLVREVHAPARTKWLGVKISTGKIVPDSPSSRLLSGRDPKLARSLVVFDVSRRRDLLSNREAAMPPRFAFAEA